VGGRTRYTCEYGITTAFSLFSFCPAQFIIMSIITYFIVIHVVFFLMDVIKLSKIPGPVPVPVLGNLYDRMALTSVRPASSSSTGSSFYGDVPTQ